MTSLISIKTHPKIKDISYQSATRPLNYSLDIMQCHPRSHHEPKTGIVFDAINFPYDCKKFLG